MKKTNRRDSPAWATTAMLLALLGAGCAGDPGPSALSDAHVELPPTARVLASLSLSDTHGIKFYDLGAGESLVIEALSMDSGDAPVLDKSMMQDAPLSAVYAKVAGDAADPVALEELESFDASRPAAQEPAESTEAADAQMPSSAPESAVIEKDAFSDAYFFSSNWCRSCMGFEGSRFPGMPTDRAVCVDAPDACVTGAAAPYTANFSSKNLSIAGYNQASSGTGTIGMYLNDPCQHDSWWSRKFSACTKGSRLAYVTMQPRYAYGLFTSTSSTSWSRRAEWKGPGNIGIMFDYF